MPAYPIRDVQLFANVSGAGAPILFVHGFPFHGGMWDAQVAALPEWRTVVPDLRGFGRSGPGELDAWTMDTFADDLAELIRVLEVGPVVLCGLSMGGYVAFAFWRRHGELCRGLVLADTRAAADDEAGRTGRHEMAERVLADGTGFVADGMLPNLLSADTRRERPAVVARVRAMIEGTPAVSIARAQKAMAARPDSTRDLAGIDVPVLVVAGEEDAIIPVDVTEDMAESIPGARLDLVPGAGHLAPMEDPATFNRALNTWLASLR
ncbi:MAG: alpha/beta fold hydrolase [Gemmatimonadota bacterium]|jgi:3-oxoadipate enol-lactonase